MDSNKLQDYHDYLNLGIVPRELRRLVGVPMEELPALIATFTEAQRSMFERLTSAYVFRMQGRERRKVTYSVETQKVKPQNVHQLTAAIPSSDMSVEALKIRAEFQRELASANCTGCERSALIRKYAKRLESLGEKL